MKIFLFVILTYVMGFISAVPVGAVQIEVARRAVTGHLRAAIVVVIGSLVADVLIWCCRILRHCSLPEAREGDGCLLACRSRGPDNYRYICHTEEF
ncbi:MAG TPA: hypothetical protein ENH30_07325 [Nitrospirae bacterium]|nr:hypothetical protein [Nitrospirota bacterium]